MDTPPHLLTIFPSPGLSVPNVHGALAPLAIPSAAAAAAAAGRIAIPGLAGAGNSVLLVSNLNPEVRASSFQPVGPGSTSGGVTLWGLSANGSRLSSCQPWGSSGVSPLVAVQPLCAGPLTASFLGAQSSLILLYALVYVSSSVIFRVEMFFDT